MCCFFLVDLFLKWHLLDRLKRGLSKKILTFDWKSIFFSIELIHVHNICLNDHFDGFSGIVRNPAERPGSIYWTLTECQDALPSTKYTLSQLILPLTLGDKHSPDPSLQIRRAKLTGLRSRRRSKSFWEAEAQARWSDTQGGALNLFPFGLILTVPQSRGRSQKESITCL